MNSLTDIIHQKDTVQYSKLSLINSTVKPLDILSNLTDVIHEGYEPFYVKQMKLLGHTRFIELANKARAGSNTPQKLFCWMLTHQEQVK